MIKENFYFKYLDIPYDHSEIVNLITKYPLLNTNRFDKMDIEEMRQAVPSIFKWFDANNMEPVFSFLINHGPGFRQTIHVDQSVEGLGINFPVNLDASNSITRMYEPKEKLTSDIVDLSVGYPFLKYEPEQVMLKTMYTSTKPALIHIHKPHSAWNNTTHTRGVLTFRFKEDPWFLVEKEAT
jgi:hypothetical protein